jgi:hypothetical protein
MTDSPEVVLPSRVETLNQIFEWSNLLTGETAFGSHEYIWPKPAGILLERLRHSSGGFFIAIIGLQGVGKSSAALTVVSELQKTLDQRREESARVQGKDPHKNPGKWNVLHVKHLGSGSLLSSVESATEDLWKDLYGKWVGEAFEDRFRNDRPFQNRVRSQIGVEKANAAAQEHGLGYLDDVEMLLPARALKRTKQKAVEAMLGNVHTVIIDLPDYSKTDKRLMVKDLNEVQKFWNWLCYGPLKGGVPNFVVVIQKEMLRDHFLFGKMDVIEIKPFTPNELVDAYAKIWEKEFTRASIDLSTWPFEGKVLLHLARLSRGIFRRFLRYIRMCLEPYAPFEDFGGELVDPKRVQEAVDPDEVQKDWDLELSEVFKSQDAKRFAAKIIAALMKTDGVSQKKLAEVLKMSEASLSRILDRLEDYAFVRRERSGAEKIVRANI